MEFPEALLVVFRYKFIVWVIGRGIFEGKSGHDQCEKYDPQSKNISLKSIVFLLGLEIKLMDLRSHISFFGSLESIAENLGMVVGGVGKTEVSQFNLNFRLRLSNENIFQFQISMHEIVTMQVTQRLADLNKDGSKLGEGGFFDPNEVQETSMLGIFHHQNISAALKLFILTCTLETNVLLVF